MLCTECVRKKQLIALFVEYFNENTICIDFQFHDPKGQDFFQRHSTKLLFQRRSTKEGIIMAHFVGCLKKIHKNIKAYFS